MQKAVQAVLLIQQWIKDNIDLDLGYLTGEFSGEYHYHWALRKGGLLVKAGCSIAFVIPKDSGFKINQRDAEDYELIENNYFRYRSKTELWDLVDNWRVIKSQILARYHIVKLRDNFIP